MEIKRIEKFYSQTVEWDVRWMPRSRGGGFDWDKGVLKIGCQGAPKEVFDVILHELVELVALELHIRYDRPDCDTDYLFVYDHRQHTMMCTVLAGYLAQFLEGNNG